MRKIIVIEIFKEYSRYKEFKENYQKNIVIEKFDLMSNPMSEW